MRQVCDTEFRHHGSVCFLRIQNMPNVSKHIFNERASAWRDLWIESIEKRHVYFQTR